MNEFDINNEKFGEITVPRGSIWAASAVVKLTDLLAAGIDFIADQFVDHTAPETCRTPEDLRVFARKIQASQPGFAAELIAAANRADEEK